MTGEAFTIAATFVIAGCCIIIAAVHVAHLMHGKFIDDSDGDK